MNPYTRIQRICLTLTLLAVGIVPVAAQIRPADSLSNQDQIDQILFAGDGTDQVLRTLELLTDRVILRPQNLPEMSFNFDSQGPLTRGEAIKAIESILSMNGLAIIEMDEKFLRAVPVNTQVNALTPEFITDTSLPEGLNSQKLYAKIYTIRFIEMEKAQQVIQQFRTQGLPPAVIFEQSSKMLITDSLNNLRRIDDVLKTADTPSSRMEQLSFIQLENTQARDIAQRLQSLLANSLQGFLVGQTVIEADERTNQIILLSHPANRPLIDTMVSNLDVNVSPLTTTRIFQANHATVTGGGEGEGQGLVSILNEIISGQREARQRAENERNANNRNNRNNTPQVPPPTTGPEGPAGSPVADSPSGGVESEGSKNVQFSEYVGVVADERTNSIIAFGTRSDLQQIEILMEQLDVLLPQVLIEVIIAEVTLNENETRGIDALGINIDRVSGVWGLSDIAVAGGGIDISNGNITDASLGGTLGDFNLDLVIGAAAGNGNVRVLNAPQILTTHAREGQILVGQRRPVVTSSQSDSTGVSTRSNVQLRDIGIELVVTPLIGADGKIQLEIFQKVENLVGSVSIDGNEQPIIGNREATSFVSVRDREVVILGGLQEFNISETESRMGLLGNLPLVGDLLFTRKGNDTERRELIIFIKPHIVADTEAVEALTEERRERSPAIDYEVENYIENGVYPPEPEADGESSNFFNPRARAN